MTLRFHKNNILKCNFLNSFNGKIQSDGGKWTTIKKNKEYHGYGLENIQDAVRKYNGIYDIDTKDNEFMLTILFQYNL